VGDGGVKTWRTYWKKQNLSDMRASGIPFEHLSKTAILCQGYVFDVYIGTWHKQGNAKEMHGQSAVHFIKFLRKQPPSPASSTEQGR
jgi:hypothetical protein